MRTIPDLAIPEVKPALELYRGVLRQKMSPRWTHSRLQSALAIVLTAWASERGRVGTEWRFYFIEQDGAASSSLVPDVAYLSFARMPKHPREAAEQPTIAPDIAIEILSPDDRARDVNEKVALYLAYGTAHVVVVDPQTASIAIYEPGREPRLMAGSGSFTVVDDLRIDLDALFSPDA
jgi:Uma2 family endonuclease